MTTRPIDVEKLLERATALAKSARNLEIMDWVMILHGYVELRTLQSTNFIYGKKVDEAINGLLQAARRDNHWSLLLELEEDDSSRWMARLRPAG